MRRLFSLVSLVILMLGCGTGPGDGPVDDNTPPGNADISRIEHIIVFMQENRSFDNYFGQLNAYRTANGAPADVDGLDRVVNASNPSFDGTTAVPVFRMKTVCHEDVSPSWNEAHVQRNRSTPDVTNPALMDGFVFTAAAYARSNNIGDQEGLRAMGYYDQTHLPYYYFMATNFAISDRFFSPIMAKSEPNRLFLYAATSGGFIAVPDSTLSQRTIFHLLDEKNISWKVYTTDPGVTTLKYFQPFADQRASNIVPLDQYFTDLQNNTLPQVAYIETGLTTGLDEHPGNNIQKGAAHAARIINALMGSTSWQSSAFFLTYDEAGGMYDHVPPVPAVNPDGIPPKLTEKETSVFADNFTMTGHRIPLLVISPWVKKSYVSHTPMDFTAILKFIEERFGLSSLTQRDAAQPSMREFFDFRRATWLTPPSPPEQPVLEDAANCYYGQVP